MTEPSDVGICLYCGDECNPCSQVCGPCMRIVRVKNPKKLKK